MTLFNGKVRSVFLAWSRGLFKPGLGGTFVIGLGLLSGPLGQAVLVCFCCPSASHSGAVNTKGNFSGHSTVSQYTTDTVTVDLHQNGHGAVLLFLSILKIITYRTQHTVKSTASVKSEAK